MLAASVCSRRTSDSSKPSSRSKSASAIRPRTTPPPPTIGTSRVDFSVACVPGMTKLPKRFIAPGTSRLISSVSPVRKMCGPKPRLSSVRRSDPSFRRAPRSSE